MVNRKTAIKIRKTHRYLGIFLGIQFLMWTVSGLYFSWTNIDEIHGDQFHREVHKHTYTNLAPINALMPKMPMHSLELRNVANYPYYWVNDSLLVDAFTGNAKNLITQEEAVKVAEMHVMEGLKVKEVTLITKTDKHHEYRERPLPAYVITYDHPENLMVYVAARDGSFQRLRHRSWRWFDFLWMTHTMDYEGRDNFNNLLLRAFSLLGLVTVLSGFVLWYTSSPTIRKFLNRIYSKKISII